MAAASPHRKATIVIVDSSLAVTGGLRCASRIARLMQPSADTILVLPRQSRVEPADLEAFAEVIRLPLVQLRRSVSAALLYLPALLVAGWNLHRLLARRNAAALIVNDFFMMQGAVARMLGYRGRIVTWVRFDPTRFPKALSRFWLVAGYRVSDAVIAVSDFIVSRLPPSTKVRRVYDSVDLDITPPTVARSGRERDIVCVANYIQGKGQDHAIDAFAVIADEFPDASLTFHGGDMGMPKNRLYLETLKDRARTSGFGDRIRFEDFARDLPAATADSLVSLVLSESESFSLSCLESSQLGLPVIAFRSGGPAEIIVDAKTGFLCEVGDVPAVARALRTLLKRPELSREMGRNGAGHVQEKFGREVFVEELRNILAFRNAPENILVSRNSFDG